jgi:hypothetical protein
MMLGIQIDYSDLPEDLGKRGSLYYFGRNRRSAITPLVERIQLKYLCDERTWGSPALCLSHLFYPHLRGSSRVFPESLGEVKLLHALASVCFAPNTMVTPATAVYTRPGCG